MQGLVTEQAVVGLLPQLIAIPSINPALRRDEPVDWFGEERLAIFVRDWLVRAGIDAAFDEVEPGRPNVVARIGGRRGPRMIWEGHLDTAQVAGMTVAPFTPVIRDGRITGRGAVDDKGCLTMFMLAMQVLKAEGCPLDLTFLAASDEESTFKGVTHHIARTAPYDFGVAGEPTSLGIVTACKGVIRWKVTIEGRAAHTSTPEDGIDAGAIGRELIAAFQDAVKASARPHPLLGLPTLTCTRFEAGEGFNTVPARAELAFDYRLLPERTGPEAWDELLAVAQRFAAGLPDGAVLQMHPTFVDSISMEVPAEHRIVSAMQDVCRRFDCPSTIRGVPFGSDATKLTRAGSPTIVFGPGSIGQAHTADEYVEIAEVAKAANMLIELVRAIAA
jgi:succinyl-diaminopimelate desuccinylase